MIKNRIRDTVTGVLLHIMWLFPVDDQKIIFKSFRGQNCGDNPGAIYREMIRRRPELKYYWVMRDPTIEVPGATVVRNGSFAELFHLATSKVWVDNKRKGMWCTKRKGQYYIQTWHAGICGKKVEADAKGALSEYYLKNAKKDSQNADLFLSDSQWTTNLYRRAFYYTGRILEHGIPRADILFKDKEITKKKVYNYWGITESTKLLLYAPTFRIDERLDVYNIDYESLHKTLTRKFGGEWKIILRLHPNIARKYRNLPVDREIMIDGSQYQNINELIVASEILVTDYSSCMFDAMEAGKKVFLYAVDVEEYDKDRGRYFEFSELPFPFATSNDELADNIEKFQEESYSFKVEEFTEKLGLYEGGHAAEAVCDQLDQVI